MQRETRNRCVFRDLTILFVCGVFAALLVGCGDGGVHEEAGEKKIEVKAPPIREVRFLNTKNPKPKHWLKEKTGSGNYGTVKHVIQDDMGTTIFTVSRDSDHLLFVLDSDGNGQEDPTDARREQAISKAELEWDLFWMDDGGHMKIHDVYFERAKSDDKWLAAPLLKWP